jgi:hypothetical protein
VHQYRQYHFQKTKGLGIYWQSLAGIFYFAEIKSAELGKKSKKIACTILVWLVFIFLSPGPTSAQSPFFDQTFRKENLSPVNDSISLILDTDSLAKAFVQDVFMPVCTDTLCKPVYMSLFWDLGGSYLEYRVDERIPLTKLDHKPFLPEDYKDLHSILLNKNSILQKYTPEQIATLVKREPGSEEANVDAISGATPYEIKQETVEGALYTCHTLWFYCYGEVQAILREYTKEKLLNEELVHRMINSGSTNLVLFGMEHMQSYEPEQFQADLLDAIRGNSPSLANQIISRLPADMINNNKFARSFWDLYRNLHSSSQLELLVKLRENPCLPESVIDEMLMSSLYTRENLFVRFMEVFLSQEDLSAAQDKQIKGLLTDRRSSLSKQAQESLQKFSER